MKKRKTNKSWDKYCKFVADFETTHHKNFSDSEILAYDRQGLGSTIENNVSLDFSPNESSKMFLGGLMSLKDFSYKLNYENMVDFFNNIASMTYDEHHTKALVYFHNLAYDGRYILNWLLQHGWSQTLETDDVTHLPVISRKEFACLISGGKFFNLHMWWRGIYIVFLDSIKLFPMSLGTLGEEIGFKKLKELVDYKQFEIRTDHKYPADWLTYLKRDVEILAKYLKNFFELQPKACSMKRQTIGSIAYSYIKKVIQELTPNFTIEDYNKFQWWFHGGLCFPSLDYWAKWVWKKNKIRMIDKCSMYPSMMCKALPYGEPLTQAPIDSDYCCYYEIDIKSAVIKKEYSDIACIWKPFTYKNGTKVIIPQEHEVVYQYLQEVYNAKYYVIDIELDLWKKLYDIDYKIVNTIYFKTSDYLKPTIELLFKDKQQATSKGARTKAKLTLNNLYGKLAQKPVRPQEFYGELKELEKYSDKYIIKNEKRNVLYKAYNINQIKKDTDKAQPIFIASYITALARVDLLSRYLLIKEHGGTFLYSDTDSIAFIENKPIQFTDIGNNLGMWEYEKFNRASGFCCLCPKQYRIIGSDYAIVKSATAGVKKEDMNEVANLDYNYDIGSNPKYHMVKTQLKQSVNGAVVFDSSFNFEKWRNLKHKVIIRKEIKNYEKKDKEDTTK